MELLVRVGLIIKILKICHKLYLRKYLQKIILYLEPSGFVTQIGGGFRQSNIRQAKPMVGRKVVDTLAVAQVK